MEPMPTLPGRQGDEPDATASDASVPALVAALYDEAPTPLRVRLLNGLLRPVGPLALAAVAAGAFARLLPSERWSSVQVQLDDVLGIQAQQVLELALYVEQKAPELLWRLAETVATSPLALSTISGALLLMALRSRNQGTAPNDKR